MQAMDEVFDCFNPCFSGCLSRIGMIASAAYWIGGFNPCFSGCLSRIEKCPIGKVPKLCFNPCFSGCLSDGYFQEACLVTMSVSILVLVDVFPE